MRLFGKSPHWLAIDTMVEAYEMAIEASAPTPPSATTIGALVVMLDRSYQSYLTRRTTLEAEIAERTEALRQVNTALSSLGAALLAAADDPVLTDDERTAAESAGQVQMDEALSGLDLTPPT